MGAQLSKSLPFQNLLSSTLSLSCYNKSPSTNTETKLSEYWISFILENQSPDTTLHIRCGTAAGGYFYGVDKTDILSEESFRSRTIPPGSSITIGICSTSPKVPGGVLAVIGRIDVSDGKEKPGSFTRLSYISGEYQGRIRNSLIIGACDLGCSVEPERLPLDAAMGEVKIVFGGPSEEQDGLEIMDEKKCVLQSYRGGVSLLSTDGNQEVRVQGRR